MRSDYLPAAIFQELTAEAIAKFNVPRHQLLKVLSEYTGIKISSFYHYLSDRAKNVNVRALKTLESLLDGIADADIMRKMQESARVNHEEYIALVDDLMRYTGKGKWTVYLALARVTGRYPELFDRAYTGKGRNLERRIFERVQIFAEETREKRRLEYPGQTEISAEHAREVFREIKKRWKLSDIQAKRLIANFRNCSYESVRVNFRKSRQKVRLEFYQTLVALHNSGYTRTEAEERAQKPVPAGFVHIQAARHAYELIKSQGRLDDSAALTLISRATGIHKETIRNILAKKRKNVRETLAEKIAKVAAGSRYDCSREYLPGEMIYHPLFGYGFVSRILPKQMMEVEFRDKETATLKHSLTEDPRFNRNPEQIDLSIYAL